MATGHYLTITNKLVSIDCCNCGVMFAVPNTFDDERRDNGKGFYCPNGHILSYHETEIQRLRKQIEKEKSRSERAETRASYWQKEQQRTERQRIAMKGQLTKARKRAGAGMCPECKRNFPQLADHVKTKHPEFDPAKV